MVALLAAACSFVAPYWTDKDNGQIGGVILGRHVTRGLIGHCRDDNCEWVYEDNFEMWKDSTFTGECLERF